MLFRWVREDVFETLRPELTAVAAASMSTVPDTYWSRPMTAGCSRSVPRSWAAWSERWRQRRGRSLAWTFPCASADGHVFIAGSASCLTCGESGTRRTCITWRKCPEEVVKVFGACLKIDGVDAREFREVVGAAWISFHTRRPLWSAWGHVAESPGLHMTVFPSMAWASGTRHRTTAELQGLRTLMLQ